MPLNYNNVIRLYPLWWIDHAGFVVIYRLVNRLTTFERFNLLIHQIKIVRSRVKCSYPRFFALSTIQL